ncbi:hypothetical protein BOQ63_000100 (plasmid) [Streptomyces viridifaciens]|nr:hypothetical protein BOQ63_000100 [Streptomyces viridifaciens]
MRAQEWSTLLLPELGLPGRQPEDPAVFPLQACAKYGRWREAYVPPGALELFVLLEREAIVRASAPQLARRSDELFVVDRVAADVG